MFFFYILLLVPFIFCLNQDCCLVVILKNEWSFTHFHVIVMSCQSQFFHVIARDQHFVVEKSNNV